MKIQKMFLVLLSLSLVSAAGFAEGKNEGPGKGNPERPWLEKADLNKDGNIGVEEAQQAEDAWKQKHQENREAKREEMKAKADVNGDGSVNDAEKQAAKDVWAQKKEDRKEDRQEKREEFKEKREEWKEEHPKMDKDNNPPGPRGGEGTNWENKPGPQGGPGAGPDHNQRDKDNNPPGMKGGPRKQK